MDSSRFIRRRTVLAAWLAVPALLLLITELGASGFREFQQVAARRAAALEQLTPQMIAENRLFEQFLEGFQFRADSGGSVEDRFISFINEAADRSGVVISSVQLEQEAVDAAAGISRIRIHLKGSGSGRTLANFLKNVKNQDARIYEERVVLTRSAEDSNAFQIEADLGKICVASPGGRP